MSETATDFEIVNKVIKDISNQMTIIESARLSIKEAKEGLAEEQNLDKKVLNKMVTIYHKQNAADTFAEALELEDYYDKTFPSKG